MKDMSRIVRELVMVIALAVAVFSPGALVLLAQSPPAPGPPGGFPDLIGMLKATPGVLGVDAALRAEHRARSGPLGGSTPADAGLSSLTPGSPLGH